MKSDAQGSTCGRHLNQSRNQTNRALPRTTTSRLDKSYARVQDHVANPVDTRCQMKLLDFLNVKEEMWRDCAVTLIELRSVTRDVYVTYSQVYLYRSHLNIRYRTAGLPTKPKGF